MSKHWSDETIERMEQFLYTNRLTITGFSYKKIARSIRYISAPALERHHPKKGSTCFWGLFS
jgi:hypothetical protein